MKEVVSKLIISFIIFSLTIGFANAATTGGGGGGSERMDRSSSGGDLGFFFYDLKCFDTGQIVFIQKPTIKPVIVEKEDGTKLTVNGQWKFTKFQSEEAEITEKGTYLIEHNKTRNRTVDCPGLKFSCKLVNISVKGCINDVDGINAKFDLAGIGTTPEGLNIQFTLSKSFRKIIEYKKNSYSKELKNLSFTQISANTYELNVPNGSKVSKLQVYYDGCVGKYYTYSQIKCKDKSVKSVDDEKVVKEVPGSELKCGGYLKIEDRVKCRLSSYEENNDYDIFLPEECKTREDWKECLKSYQVVQKCWVYPHGNERISCVKNSIGLGDISTEKNTCNEFSDKKRENCLSDLKNKVNSLIKFRFYDLEEEAEIFMEDGKLSVDDTADFIVKMEISKQTFNSASTKEEKKNIILKVRQHWIDMIKKLRVV